MIDLHTHTTASDGLCAPGELLACAYAAGISILAITDHDTVAGIVTANVANRTSGMPGLVPGIEITAIAEETDVHVLGYWIDVTSDRLLAFLARQRLRRLDRVRAVVERLRPYGIALDAGVLVRPALDDPSTTIGRPAIARAMVAAGFVADTNEAFDRRLARGRPAFVAREGPTPVEVVREIHAAGGIASLAHPGLLERDDWIEPLACAGLDALEAYHSKHDESATAHYLALAARLGLAVSGGSDFHGDASHGAALGSVALPQSCYEDLAARRRAASRAIDSGRAISS